MGSQIFVCDGSGRVEFISCTVSRSVKSDPCSTLFEFCVFGFVRF